MTMEDIQKLIKDFEKSKLTELELEFKEIKLKLSKNKITNTKQNNNAELVESNPSTGLVINPGEIKEFNETIKSPLVGTFYEASSPEAEAFVKVGDPVKKGDIVCIIEAMKIMNEITSNVDGVIKTINFKNGDVVGYDDVIFAVDTNVTSN